MKITNSTFFVKHWIKFSLVFFSLLLLATYIRIFAWGTSYLPGETLNPECPPGEANCTVNTRAAINEMFDGSQVITRSGISGSGTSVGGTTTREFLQNYFFPAVSSSTSISISGGNSIEYGDSSPLSLNWNANKGTYPISSITLSANNGGYFTSGTPIIATGNTQSGNATAQYTNNTPTTFTINVTPTTGSTITSSAAISFYNRKYYGVSTTGTNITDGEIISLANKSFSSSRATGSITSQINFGTNPGDYVYFAWPATFEGGSLVCRSTGGAPTYTTTPGTTVDCFNAGSNSVTSFILEQRNFTNAFGYTTLYNIYRSKNPVGGSYWVQ
jgi:hypothetical protein